MRLINYLFWGILQIYLVSVSLWWLFFIPVTVICFGVIDSYFHCKNNKLL